MKRSFAALLAACALALPGCLYVHIKKPLDTDLDQTRLGSKVGTAHWQSLFWAVAWGDAGTQAAARSGGITTINHADVEEFMILYGLYLKRTTIVYGE